uniref:Peptidase S1 domain-containing protein n=1 Tax=Glossina brevipalpis TaxID=37001 RepID=A0A1A9WD02_9MUSC
MTFVYLGTSSSPQEMLPNFKLNRSKSKRKAKRSSTSAFYISYFVWLHFEDHRKLGSILSENVILTEYALDLSHIVLGTGHSHTENEVREKRKTINGSKSLPHGPHDLQIVLIKLNRNITLTPPIPPQNLKQTKRLPSLHENALCVELIDKDHCEHLHDGDALLCDDILTCMLSHNDQCDNNQPSPCASLLTHRN